MMDKEDMVFIVEAIRTYRGRSIWSM